MRILSVALVGIAVVAACGPERKRGGGSNRSQNERITVLSTAYSMFERLELPLCSCPGEKLDLPDTRIYVDIQLRDSEVLSFSPKPRASLGRKTPIDSPPQATQLSGGWNLRSRGRIRSKGKTRTLRVECQQLLRQPQGDGQLFFVAYELRWPEGQPRKVSADALEFNDCKPATHSKRANKKPAPFDVENDLKDPPGGGRTRAQRKRIKQGETFQVSIADVRKEADSSARFVDFGQLSGQETRFSEKLDIETRRAPRPSST